MMISLKERIDVFVSKSDDDSSNHCEIFKFASEIKDLLKSKQLIDDIDEANLVKLLQTFIANHADQLRRAAGTLLFELFKHSPQAVDLYVVLHNSAQFKHVLGDVILSLVEESLKVLAGAIISLLNTKGNIPLHAFWSNQAVKTQVRALFPQAPSSQWANPFQEFLSSLAIGNLMEDATDYVFSPIALSHGDGLVPVAQLQGLANIVCELKDDVDILTCAQIAFDSTPRFIDISLETIDKLTPQIGRQLEPTGTCDQLVVELHRGMSCKVNGVHESTGFFVFVFEKNTIVKEVTQEIRQRTRDSPHPSVVIAASQLTLGNSSPIDGGSAKSPIAAQQATVPHEVQLQVQDSAGGDVVEDSCTNNTGKESKMLKLSNTEHSRARSELPPNSHARKLRDSMHGGDEQATTKGQEASANPSAEKGKPPQTANGAKPNQRANTLVKPSSSGLKMRSNAHASNQNVTATQDPAPTLKKDVPGEGRVSRHNAPKTSTVAAQSSRTGKAVTASKPRQSVPNDDHTQMAQQPRRSTRQSDSHNLRSEQGTVVATNNPVKPSITSKRKAATVDLGPLPKRSKGKAAPANSILAEDIVDAHDGKPNGRLKSVKRGVSTAATENIESDEYEILDEPQVTKASNPDTKGRKPVMSVHCGRPAEVSASLGKVSKKPTLVHFDETGPQNQGKVRLQASSETKEHERSNIAPKPIQSRSNKPFASKKGKERPFNHIEDIDTFTQREDDAYDGRSASPSRESDTLSPAAEQVHGSQISKRVSTDGSPFAKGTELPLDDAGFVQISLDDNAVAKHCHPNTSASQKLMQAPDGAAQLRTPQAAAPASTPKLPPSRNPDNHVRLPRKVSESIIGKSSDADILNQPRLPEMVQNRAGITPSKHDSLTIDDQETIGKEQQPAAFSKGTEVAGFHGSSHAASEKHNISTSIPKLTSGAESVVSQVEFKVPKLPSNRKRALPQPTIPNVGANEDVMSVDITQKTSFARQASDETQGTINAHVSAIKNSQVLLALGVPQRETRAPTVKMDSEPMVAASIPRGFEHLEGCMQPGAPTMFANILIRDPLTDAIMSGLDMQQVTHDMAEASKQDRQYRHAGDGLAEMSRHGVVAMEHCTASQGSKSCNPLSPGLAGLKQTITVPTELRASMGNIATKSNGLDTVSAIGAPTVSLEMPAQCHSLNMVLARAGDQKPVDLLTVGLSRLASTVPSRPIRSRTAVVPRVSSSRSLSTIPEQEEHHVSRPSPPGSIPTLAERNEIGEEAGHGDLQGMDTFSRTLTIPKKSKFTQFLHYQHNVMNPMITTHNSDASLTAAIAAEEDLDRTLVDLAIPENEDQWPPRQVKNGGSRRNQGRPEDSDQYYQHDGIDGDGDHSMSDDSSSASGTPSHSSDSEDIDDEMDSDASDDETPQELAFREQMEWEEALTAHQQEFYLTFGRISQGLLRHILNTESAVDNVIKEHQNGGLDLISRLTDSQADEASAHSGSRQGLQGPLTQRLQDLLSQSSTDLQRALSVAVEEKEFANVQTGLYEEQSLRMESLLETWG